MTINFKDTTLPIDMINSLSSLGYTNMTPIQQNSIKALLENKDMIAQAKTGSGKTVAFLTSSLLKIDSSSKNPQLIIILPTRELASQVANEARNIGKYIKDLKVLTLCGGVPLTPQVKSLEKGSNIIVGTPGRLNDHISRETIDFSDIKVMVLDEADRLLDMGFHDEVVRISNMMPNDKQTILFSATFPPKIESLVKEVCKKPVRVSGDILTDDSIEEFAYVSGDKDKMLIDILSHYKPESSIIFCNTKVEVDRVDEMLYKLGFDSLAFHGDFSQYERDEIFIRFSNRSIPILVATDIASRGLDIDDVNLVVNYDLPDKPENYTHRIGRTGRLDAKGIAISIYQIEQKDKLNFIAPKVIKKSFENRIKKLPIQTSLVTLVIAGGKQQKVRKGDILGTLCKDLNINSSHIGNINITPKVSFVAIDKDIFIKVLKNVERIKIKGKRFKVWTL
jgi:ATP-independent RNA helicase DbpA